MLLYPREYLPDLMTRARRELMLLSEHENCTTGGQRIARARDRDQGRSAYSLLLFLAFLAPGTAVGAILKRGWW